MSRRRAAAHVRRNPGKYGLGTVLVVTLVVVQLVWDISANDLAAYVQPLFSRLLGPPPAP